MIAGAIFDADGTLLDSMPIWDNAAALYLEGLGYVPEPGLGRILYPMSMAEGADYLIARYGLSQSREEIVCGVSAAIEDFYFHRAQPKAGLEAFLRQLQERGIPMAVATSRDRRLVEAALKRLGLLSRFKGIFTCAQAGAGKSRPDVYHLASRSLGGPKPQSVWVFEDALFAASTAGRAGYRVAVVRDPSADEDREQLEQLADYAMEDFTDFNGFYQQALK